MFYPANRMQCFITGISEKFRSIYTAGMVVFPDLSHFILFLFKNVQAFELKSLIVTSVSGFYD